MATLSELVDTLAEHLNYPRPMLRPWPLHYRTNNTLRPSALDIDVEALKTVRPRYSFVSR